jgi:hypothetical protein
VVIDRLVIAGLDDGGEKRGWPHLFACPKAPVNKSFFLCIIFLIGCANVRFHQGVERCAADDAFGDSPAAKAAYIALRTPIVKRLNEIKALMKK